MGESVRISGIIKMSLINVLDEKNENSVTFI